MKKEEGREPRRSGSEIVDPWSALVLVLVDNLWTLAGWAVMLWAVTIPLSFLAVFGLTYPIQRFRKGDAPRRALWVAAMLGALAAVPTPITGTTAGALLLGLAGIKSLRLNR